MSRLSKAVTDIRGEEILRKSETVKNFMGGDSYTVDPLTRLKLISASSIFGEPSYYIGSKVGKKVMLPAFIRGYVTVPEIKENDILGILSETGDIVDIMEKAIDDALEYNFGATIKWAAELRNDFYIRLNPQVIMVRAAMHPKREEFTKEHPGVFNTVNQEVMRRADDGISQVEYYLYKNKSKRSMPNLLKRSLANHFSGLSDYELLKYKNSGIGIIDSVRICHANSNGINKLLREELTSNADTNTWEELRRNGKDWAYIFEHVNMGHMALLRNIRGFLSEVEDKQIADKYFERLKGGVLKGKQFPYRYYAAYNAIKSASNIYHKQAALDTLEECMDISLENLPKLKGKTMCLSDNSGSAWGTVTSEYGTFTVAEIDNLSSVITAMRSDEGYVGVFGNTLKVYEISKRRGCLEQAMEISKSKGEDVGLDTEGGIWEFFYDAMKKHEHWDNIFIYSDQQAGIGGLYGTHAQNRMYRDMGYCTGYNHINVFKLVLDYRARVSHKVNVFSVQTAGYDNSVLPNYAYRINLMYGWTGKEALFASAVISQWDKEDEAKNK